jgi:hypothetical protein
MSRQLAERSRAPGAARGRRIDPGLEARGPDRSTPQSWLGVHDQIGNAAIARLLTHVQRCGDHVSPGCSCAEISGRGQAHQAVGHGPANVSLKGKTTASFDGGSFHTEGVTTEAGESCKACKAKNCIHVTGNVVTAYRVSTRVSLPSVAQFRNLTPCQREAVRQAIEDQLAPHEQDHVAAFGQYTGSSTQAFDLTTCRTALPAKIDAMVRSEEQQRRDEAKAASAALDPFQIDVDLNCSEDT